MQDPTASPNRLPWPPMILIGTLMASVGLEFLWPTTTPIPTLLGWFVVILGLGFDLTAIVTMWREKTNILPNRPADRLLTTGIFAVSRNPIYLGNNILLVGMGIAFNSLWPILLMPIAVWAVLRLAIRREETHLAHKFTGEWQAYAENTPRWIGLPRRQLRK